MSIDAINDFREKYKKLLKWDSYMKAKCLKMDTKSAKWKELVNEFFEAVVEPVEEAWRKLSPSEKQIFFPEDKPRTKKQVLENVPF